MAFKDTYDKARDAVSKLKMFVFSDEKQHLLEYLSAVLDAGLSLESSLSQAQSEIASLRAKLGHARRLAKGAVESAEDGDAETARGEADMALDNIEAAQSDAADVADTVERAQSVASELKNSASR